jgi:hypothetical protein
MSHKSLLRERPIPHPYVAFMISPYLLNSSIDPEMYYTYFYADQISFSFLTIHKQFTLSLLNHPGRAPCKTPPERAWCTL